jgi:hypothetical protein
LHDWRSEIARLGERLDVLEKKQARDADVRGLRAGLDRLDAAAHSLQRSVRELSRHRRLDYDALPLPLSRFNN